MKVMLLRSTWFLADCIRMYSKGYVIGESSILKELSYKPGMHFRLRTYVLHPDPCMPLAGGAPLRHANEKRFQWRAEIFSDTVRQRSCPVFSGGFYGMGALQS